MNEITLKIDFRLLCVVLLIIIGVMLAIWRPWTGTNLQTITVTGEAKVKAEPDQFVFAPTYQKENSTNATAISEVSKTGNEVIAKLKELGLAEKDLITNVSVNPGYEPLTGKPTAAFTAQYMITAKTTDKAVAQKVLDYLVTTAPVYGVSPQSTFQDETRKRLETEARGQAITDAKARAEQTAMGLGTKVTRVVSVADAQWGGPVYPLTAEAKDLARSSAGSTTPPVLLTGEQEVTYSVSVTFRIR